MIWLVYVDLKEILIGRTENGALVMQLIAEEHFFYHFKSNARPGQISTFYFLIFWNGVILWRNFVQNLIMATKIWKKHPLWSFRELFQDGYQYSAKS